MALAGLCFGLFGRVLSLRKGAVLGRTAPSPCPRAGFGVGWGEKCFFDNPESPRRANAGDFDFWGLVGAILPVIRDIIDH